MWPKNVLTPFSFYNKVFFIGLIEHWYSAPTFLKLRQIWSRRLGGQNTSQLWPEMNLKYKYLPVTDPCDCSETSGVILWACVLILPCTFDSAEIKCIHLHLPPGAGCVLPAGMATLHFPPETGPIIPNRKPSQKNFSLCVRSVFCTTSVPLVPHVPPFVQSGEGSLWHLTNSFTHTGLYTEWQCWAVIISYGTAVRCINKLERLQCVKCEAPCDTGLMTYWTQRYFSQWFFLTWGN